MEIIYFQAEYEKEWFLNYEFLDLKVNPEFLRHAVSLILIKTKVVNHFLKLKFL